MTDEEQIKLANHWARNYETERTLKIRELAKTAAESDDAYTIGYHFAVSAVPHLPRFFTPSDPVDAGRFRSYRDITVLLTPELQGSAAAQLIAERIITKQWPDAESPEA